MTTAGWFLISAFAVGYVAIALALLKTWRESMADRKHFAEVLYQIELAHGRDRMVAIAMGVPVHPREYQA